MDKLKAIFDHQRVLIERFHPIEAANKLLEDEHVPVNLQNRHGQARLRQLAWRIVEECAEVRSSRELDHTHEELADVCHFLVELMVTAGCEPDFAEARGRAMEDWFFETEAPIGGELCLLNFIHKLALAIHQLKWRAWKQNPPSTDELKFKQHLAIAFHSFASLCAAYGMTADDLYAQYIRKNETNQKRISDGV